MVLCYSCDYAIDRIESSEKKDPTKEWRLSRLDYLPHPESFIKKTPFNIQYFYENDTLREVHKEDEWKKYYYFQNGLLTNRTSLRWNEGDTMQVDSFFYFDFPTLLKEKVSYYHFAEPQYAPQKSTYKYYFNSDSKIVKEERYDSSNELDWYYEYDWQDGNPVETRLYWDGDNQIALMDRLSFDLGKNYELNKRWDPDAILPQNNQVSASRRVVTRGGAFDRTYKINYDRQRRPTRIYTIMSNQLAIIDTLDITYQ
ncbi:MAG: hypothetical protein Sapg2KO_34710 [Saprospiraceae bacterium]